MTKQIPRNWKNKMGNQGTFNPDSIIFFGIRPNKKSEINQEDGILTTVNNIEVVRQKQCKNGTFVVVGKEWHKSRRRNYTG